MPYPLFLHIGDEPLLKLCMERKKIIISYDDILEYGVEKFEEEVFYGKKLDVIFYDKFKNTTV